jgi:hypothetical protein
MYAFVEGTPDEAFYRAHIQSYERDPANIFVYNCERKERVYDAYRGVIERYPNCTRVLFFVDKDVDDIVGKPWPLDPRICVTDCYSIENYLVERAVLARFFADYVKIRRVTVDLEAVLQRFEEEMRVFHAFVLRIMAWIVALRRAGHGVILTDVDMGYFFQMTDSGLRRTCRARLSTLARITKNEAHAVNWRDVRKTCGELQRLPPKHYIRGKFEAWWFVRFTRRIADTVIAVVKDGGGSVSINAQLNETTFIQLLARAVPSPPVIDAYLRFHLTRSLADEAPASAQHGPGILGKLRRFFPGQ